MEPLVQILMLLGISVAVVVVFQRFPIPSSRAYLPVSVILRPYSIGPAVNFLAGMMLGETEFRHQVTSAIRPLRDVL